MSGRWTCAACGTSGYFGELHFSCDSCAGDVCPKCAGMGPRDCDDPMPTVKACPKCTQDNAATFRALCEAHDPMYWAADGRAYQMGVQSAGRIAEAALALPPGEARRIYNEVIDRKVVPGQRAEYYWPEGRAA